MIPEGFTRLNTHERKIIPKNLEGDKTVVCEQIVVD
jgi:hypothetical protein